MSRDRSLPIFALEAGFLDAVRGERPRIVVEAPTGSGKSTQIPQFLADSGLCGDREIYVLQPRRLAARMLARRVAGERGGRLGDEVGYQVRFENEVSARTRIRFVTEGILIRKLIEQPDLADVAAVVLDEFHERHFFGDISLARCLEVQRKKRPDLAIVAMSATLETLALKEYLGEGCHHLLSEGRTFPVAIRYQPPRERHRGELWDQATRVIRDHLKEHGIEGHILIFMPGRYEIQKTISALRHASWSGGFELHELYGELPPDKQDAAVSPGARPKIVVATNVAETSITIDGVRLVVDAGLERRSSFDHRRSITTLHIEKISRASADQRAGRAGRTGPGTAIRLWSERDHEGRAVATPAEIQRMDLTEAVLILSSSGVRRVREFPWFERPDARALDEAIRRLVHLGALDESENLTPDGRAMGALPVPPRFGRILLEAARHGCLEYFALLIALTQSRPLFPTRKKHSAQLGPTDFARPDDTSDFQALVRAWQEMRRQQFRREAGEQLGIHAGAARDVGRVADQLIRLGARSPDQGVPVAEPDGALLARILLSGFSDRLALRHSPATLSCAVIGGRRGQLEKDSVAATKETHLFIAGEMIEVEGKELAVKLGLCTRIEESCLHDLFPDDFDEKDGAVYDERNRRVEARRERRFRDLVLETKLTGTVPPDEAAALLAERVLAGELNLKAWDEKVEAWFARINLIAEVCPEYDFAPVDEEARQLLLEQICAGATSYKEIKDRPVWNVVRDWLPPHQAGLIDFLCPESLTLSTGKSVRVHYRPGEKPRVSVLIQHLFGLKDSPVICDGRVPVVIEILAPNHRPVQVTENLAGFWTGSYPAVRAQLRGRYPKHDWPEFS
ncbi:MAG: ATP-dependent helicase HrpB [Verrucomicrobiaceae bacterium]|nr:ATP-dependent helicase HrpB [Verrucomicrobiaceae bacterium]